MAEIILSPFIQILVEKLTSGIFKKLAHPGEIDAQLKKLERWLPHIQDVLFDAGQRTVTEKSVERWLYQLRDLAYDIDDVLDELATDAMHDELSEESRASTSKVIKLFHNPFTSSPQRAKMNDKLNNITTKLQDLVEEKNALGLTVKAEKSKNMSRRLESTSLVDEHSIVGRDGDKETLLQKLLGDETCDQNFSIVPIVGIGGMGKTTLAGILYNDKQVKDHFKLKAWVCVSDEFDIFKISKIIFASVAGENKEFASLDLLQIALREKLLEKRFLIVLDDVWSESHSDWELLARPFHVGARGSKIIITTRKMQLLTKLGCNQPYDLQILSIDEALSLLSRHALGENNFDLHPTLKPHGEGIVKKCDGLPLALIALGRLLRRKTKEEWKQVLHSEIWKLRSENEIIPALRLSYLDLPAHLKQLFAYCSLFPKDYVFDKDELILLWMAEGFLQTESLGREYFEELLSRSFFQVAPNEESWYKMHDLMNDLATSVAGDILFRLDYEIEADVKKKALEKCRHMSFTSQKFTTRGKFKVLETAKSLRTFLAVSNETKIRFSRFYMSNQILVEFLPQLSLLRVLSLSGYFISEVPESIGSLKHLRYLNLSRTYITHLPEQVGNLYNLQTLLVYGCRKLEKLPSNFSKLKNLRHLDISDTPLLKKTPLGIGELISLQTLSKVIIDGGNGFALTELKDINDLHGRISIKGLEKVKNAMDAKNANLSKKKLNDLKIKWSNVFDGARNETLEKEVLGMLMPQNDKLRKLRIVSYGGMEFPGWVGDRSFSRLEHVTIRGCKKCTSLPPLGHLTLLKELFVEGMDGVKVVGSEFLGNGNCCGGVAFPSLELLSFERMKSWEEWSTKHEDIGKVFPSLRELHIKQCNKLVHASLEAFPSLLVLEIFECPDGVVKSVVRAASSITRLYISNISGLSQLSGGVMEYLGAVEEVRIEGCDEVRYLWESEAEACNILVNLRKLEIFGCKNLVRLGMKEEDNDWTCLRQMIIGYCDSLACYNCPNGMETLYIFGCQSITYVSFPRGGQKLKRLDIYNCEKLLVEESGGGEKSMVLLNSSMSLLQHVDIDGWPNLKSFPDLSCFTLLTSLYIKRCYNLESFPDEAWTKLTSLTHLIIQDCPCMDDSFPRGNWPPNLTSLRIEGLKKPISEWGPQNFPTSLVRLSLFEHSSSEDVGCCSSQLSSLLPSSLTNLNISGFEKLESLSTAFQHLTSLQHLDISDSPNLIDLPETPLPSLLTLRISNCPNLIDLPETPLPSLSSLFISSCPNLIDLPETPLPSLSSLDIVNCPKISRLPVTLLPSLLELIIRGCPELKERCSSRRGSYWPHISHIPRIHMY